MRFARLLVAPALIVVLAGVAGAAPATAPNPAVVAMSKMSGRALDVAAMRELLARFEEEIEIAYAATLNADHPPLLQWNQKMIERKSAQIKTLLGLLKDVNATPGRRGVNVVTPEVKQMRQLKGGPLERRYIPLMIERFETNVAIADVAVKRGANGDFKSLAGAIMKVERQETAMLKAWLKEWYGK
ncbi:MAG: DUF305 domain-containing protein [Armatimonadota bacterium]|nr:DUF305 domain-containing protein [Armatimonadota bacterium]